MLISETEYRYQVEEDIKPFRDVLLGLFFVTVGMLLDVAEIVRNLPAVLGLLAALLVLKFGWCLRPRARVRFAGGHGDALRAVVVRAGGEFGFVLLSQIPTSG